MSKKLRAKTGQQTVVHVQHPREGVLRLLDDGRWGLVCKRTGRLVGAGTTQNAAMKRAGKTGWYTAESLEPKKEVA